MRYHDRYSERACEKRSRHYVHFDCMNTYAVLLSSATGLARQFVPVLKLYLSPQGLKALFTRASADPGRERYRRVGMTASTSYVAKALTMLAEQCSFVKVLGSYPNAE